MSLRVGSLLRPLLGHSASCCSAGVTTPPAAPPVTCCSAGVTTPPAGTRISVPSAGLSIFVLPAALPTTTASTKNFIGVASPFQQSLSPPLRPSTFNNRFRRLCGPLPSTIALAAFAAETVSFLCRSGVLLPGPQAASWTTSLYTLPSTIAFASTNANPTWPQLRGALAGTALATCVAAAALVLGGTVPSIPVSLRVGSPLRPLLDRVATPPALSVLCGGRHSARWPQPQLWPGQLCVPSTGGKSQCASPPLQLPCSAVSLFFGRGSSPVKRKSVS